MPITAKLSRKFYEKLGDEVADELVNWFNTVDLSYRQEFRDLFETSFSRFEARLAQQTAELRAEMGQRFADLGARIDVVDPRLEQLAARLDGKLDRLESKLIRWMFVFWVGTIGTVIAIQRLL